MPSLRELANNVYNFNYYSGTGNFSQNNVKYPDPPVLFGPEATLMLKRPGFQWSPSNFDDGLVPFGVVTRLRRALNDTARIGKYLTRTPSGLIFLIKQQALQASSPDIEYDPATSKLKNFGPTRIFSPLPLLAQVAGNAIGSRFMRHGIFPKISNTQDYENYILKKDSEGGNRLKTLSINLSNRDIGTRGQPFVLQYKGGPGSKYGIGTTTINRFGKILLDNTISNDNGFIRIPSSYLLSISSYNSIKVVDKLVEGADFTENTEFNSSNFENIEEQRLGPNYDFRKYKNKAKFSKNTNIKLPESDYENLNLEKRIGIAGVRSASQRTSVSSSANTYDKVNAISLFYEKTVADAIQKKFDYNGNKVDINSAGAVSTSDLIKFRIKSLSTLAKNNAGWFMIFRAYINNIKRSVQSKWNPYNYVGRGESFYLYDGVTETISLSFTIAVSSRFEMKPTYQKLNYLIASLSPSYSTDLNMIGNIFELTVGDFINQPGIITNLDLTVDADSNWEINIDGGDDMYELPHLIKCSMTFIPIYKFLPLRSTKAPFIDIDYKENQKWLSKDLSGAVKK